MRHAITLLFALVAFSGMAQTEEQSAPDEKWKWSVGGLFTLMAPYGDHHYYDKDKERYVPQTSMVWMGSSRISDGIMHGNRPQFHLREGFFKQVDAGWTMLQLSRNLYKGIAGYSIGLQFEGSTYNFSRHCIAKSRGGRIDFEATEAELEENDLFSFHVRIPLLVGVQTPKRWLSLQTGLGLYVGGSKYEYRFKGRDEMESHHFHTSHVGAQWLVTAGIGPFTVNFTQNLTPHFKLADGTKAYPSSLTIGFDLWYAMCRFQRPSYSFSDIPHEKNIHYDITSLAGQENKLFTSLYEKELERLLVPQNTQFGVIRATPFLPESSLAYDSVNHTLVYTKAWRSIYNEAGEATMKFKKAGNDMVKVVPRKKIRDYFAPQVQTCTLAITDDEAQELKERWLDAVRNAEEKEGRALDGTRWEFFIGDQRATSYEAHEAFVKYANELMDSVYNEYQLRLEAKYSENTVKKIRSVEQWSHMEEIEWRSKEDLDHVSFADTCEMKEYHGKGRYSPPVETKEFAIQGKRYCCRYFNYGSGLPIWDIEVFQHENDRWKIVAKGIMKGPVFITAEDDACNNRIVFYKLDARIDTYTGEIKSLTKGKEIGELSLSDLLPTNSK